MHALLPEMPEIYEKKCITFLFEYKGKILLDNYTWQLECEQPNPDLRNFNGRLKVNLQLTDWVFNLQTIFQVRLGDGSMIPGSLSLENVGLRGTQVIKFY